MATYGVDFDPLPKRVRRFLKGEIAPYLRAENKKPLHRQIREMIAIYREYRVLPYHYLTHNLYGKSHGGDVLDYLPADMLIMFCSSLNPAEGIEAAIDKTMFSRKMREAGLPVVGDICTLRRDGDIRAPDGTALNFAQFVDLLQSQCENAFIKLRRGACGVAASKLAVNDIRAMGWDGLRAHLFGRGDLGPDAEFIVQGVIIQHPTLASVSPTSVSTVRIDTYADGEDIHFNTAVLRVGSGNVCTDNWATGGLIIKVDLESGKLIGNGKRDAKFGKREFSEHPLTGTRFDDVQLPYWTELTTLVRLAARQMLPLRSIGWDVTITPDGPLLIEANHDYDKFLSQQGGGGYRRLPLGQALMRQIHRSPGQRPSEQGNVLANP
jgi:hypothetical protein